MCEFEERIKSYHREMKASCEDRDHGGYSEDQKDALDKMLDGMLEDIGKADELHQEFLGRLDEILPEL